MNKLNCTQIGDVLMDTAFDHIENLKQRRAEGKDVSCEVEFYSKDICEIVEEARKMISQDDLGDMLNFIRENINFYQIMQ